MASEIETILKRTENFSASEILTLIGDLTLKAQQKISVENVSQPQEKPKYIYFGMFADYPGPQTTEEDFKDAEYHFNEDEWK